MKPHSYIGTTSCLCGIRVTVRFSANDTEQVKTCWTCGSEMKFFRNGTFSIRNHKTGKTKSGNLLIFWRGK